MHFDALTPVGAFFFVENLTHCPKSGSENLKRIGVRDIIITKQNVSFPIVAGGKNMKVLDAKTLNEIRKFNISYQKEHGFAPSYRVIKDELGIGSLATVRRYVLELEKQGVLSRDEGGSIVPLPQLMKSKFTLTPLIGSIACGLPHMAEEEYEEAYALPQAIFGTGELFMLHATGSSMIEAGIAPGDLLVIRRQDTAKDGEIVVARIDNRATLKRLYHKDGKIVLHPENKRMKDIVVDACHVQGVLVSCIKQFA
jgi:repressor LexA